MTLRETIYRVFGFNALKDILENLKSDFECFDVNINFYEYYAGIKVDSAKAKALLNTLEFILLLLILQYLNDRLREHTKSFIILPIYWMMKDTVIFVIICGNKELKNPIILNYLNKYNSENSISTHTIYNVEDVLNILEFTPSGCGNCDYCSRFFLAKTIATYTYSFDESVKEYIDSLLKELENISRKYEGKGRCKDCLIKFKKAFSKHPEVIINQIVRTKSFKKIYENKFSIPNNCKDHLLQILKAFETIENIDLALNIVFALYKSLEIAISTNDEVFFSCDVGEAFKRSISVPDILIMSNNTVYVIELTAKEKAKGVLRYSHFKEKFIIPLLISNISQQYGSKESKFSIFFIYICLNCNLEGEDILKEIVTQTDLASVIIIFGSINDIKDVQNMISTIKSFNICKDAESLEKVKIISF